MSAVNFMAKMLLLALIVATINVCIYDGFGGQARIYLTPGADDPFNAAGTLGTLYLLGWYMVAFIVLSGVIGMVVQMFKPESRDMPIRYRQRQL
jgi:hypothetical protein